MPWSSTSWSSGGTTAFDSVSHTIEEFTADGEVQRDLTLGESNGLRKLSESLSLW
jgi:hypothetical protein